QFVETAQLAGEFFFKGRKSFNALFESDPLANSSEGWHTTVGHKRPFQDAHLRTEFSGVVLGCFQSSLFCFHAAQRASLHLAESLYLTADIFDILLQTHHRSFLLLIQQ